MALTVSKPPPNPEETGEECRNVITEADRCERLLQTLSKLQEQVFLPFSLADSKQNAQLHDQLTEARSMQQSLTTEIEESKSTKTHRSALTRKNSKSSTK